MPYFGPVGNSIGEYIQAQYMLPGGGFGHSPGSKTEQPSYIGPVGETILEGLHQAYEDNALGDAGSINYSGWDIDTASTEVISPSLDAMENTAEDFVVPDEPQINSDGSINETAVENSLEGGWSLSDFMANHPGATYEDIMKEASLHSDEFAEKYLDYLIERGELDRANAYTANREDTAYQRLVRDLKAAGLNPAMMYGSSASPSSAASQGYIRMTEGANSRDIGNYSKLKKLMLSYIGYMIQKQLGEAGLAVDMITGLVPW